MLQIVILVVLALCLAITHAFSFDPRTGECEGEFAHCPASPTAAAECKMDKRLQCFSADLNEEVVFACANNDEANNTKYTLLEIEALPCSNTSMMTSNFNNTHDIQWTRFFADWDEFDLEQFFMNAKPALVVMGAIGAVLLVLITIVCVAARSSVKCCSISNTKKSKDRVEENPYYY